MAVSHASAGDWPQLQCNPQRTGYTPETLDAPSGMDVGWSVDFGAFDPPEHVYIAVQIVAHGNKVFVPTMGGNVYALDSATGGTVWRFQGNEPILHTAGVEDGRLFFATLKGSVYALDAATGRQLWRWNNGLRTGFSSAVLLADGKVFVGGRGGDFHAVSQADGVEVWSRRIPAPIYQTASFNGGRVYFAAEDMHCYCLAASDGKLLWKSEKLMGATFSDYYPLVYGGVVIVEPFTDWDSWHFQGEFFPFTYGNNEWVAKHGDSLKTGKIAPDALVELIEAQDRMVAVFEQEPQKKMRYALDELTGREKYVLPFWWQSNNGPQQPPIVDRDGMLVMPVAGFIGMGTWGRMPLERQRVVDILYDGQGGMGNTDEDITLSAAGNLVFTVHRSEGGAHYTGYFNLDTRKWTKLTSELFKRGYNEYTRLMPPGPGEPVPMFSGGHGNNSASIAFGAVYHHTCGVVHNWVPKKQE